MADLSIDPEQLFDGDIFSAIGLQDLDDAEKQELLANMTKTVFARVFLQISETLESQDRITFSELEVPALIPFLEERGINIVDMLVEEAARYRQEIIMVFLTAENPYLEETADERLAAAAA
jgi:hypothetical protein